MTSINEKMGFKRPGKRKMMKGAGRTLAAVRLTSSFCPNCPHRWIIENKIHGVLRQMCAWCSNTEGLIGAFV